MKTILAAFFSGLAGSLGLGGGGVPGVLLGSLAVSHMNSNIPGKIFGGFLLLRGIKELFRKGD